MVITITSLKLRHWWSFFKLSLWGLKIVQQTKTQKGFIEMKNTGFGYLHFTLSVWETEADVKNFARSGAHLEATKQSRKLATEIRIYTFRSDEIPDWKDAKRLLFERGKVFSFDNRTDSELPTRADGFEKTIQQESIKKQ
jgi:heme-degrading monooxygenase HmoA